MCEYEDELENLKQEIRLFKKKIEILERVLEQTQEYFNKLLKAFNL